MDDYRLLRRKIDPWNHIEQFYEKELHCDCRIVCEGTFFRAHKLILSIWSQLFEKLFESMKDENPIVILPNVDPNFFKYLLLYMYRGEIKVPCSYLHSLANTASYLKIKDFPKIPHDIPKYENKKEHQEVFTLHNATKEISSHRFALPVDAYLPFRNDDDYIDQNINNFVSNRRSIESSYDLQHSFKPENTMQLQDSELKSRLLLFAERLDVQITRKQMESGVSSPTALSQKRMDGMKENTEKEPAKGKENTVAGTKWKKVRDYFMNKSHIQKNEEDIEKENISSFTNPVIEMTPTSDNENDFQLNNDLVKLETPSEDYQLNESLVSRSSPEANRDLSAKTDLFSVNNCVVRVGQPFPTTNLIYSRTTEKQRGSDADTQKNFQHIISVGNTNAIDTCHSNHLLVAPAPSSSRRTQSPQFYFSGAGEMSQSPSEAVLGNNQDRSPSSNESSLSPVHFSFGDYLLKRSPDLRDCKEVKGPKIDPNLGKMKCGNRRRARGPKCWEFLLRLLNDSSAAPSLIKWVDKDKGIFRLMEPVIIARKWGQRTGKHSSENLTYENFARSLRYHYSTGALKPVSEGNFVYQFGPKAKLDTDFLCVPASSSSSSLQEVKAN